MAFWRWHDYEQFLDWAAMNGVNLMLDVVGQEEVQRRMLHQFGYSDNDVRQYLPGPAYFGWFYMANMQSFGGPLPQSWFAQRTELARKIHDRMEVYGITPVFPALPGRYRILSPPKTRRRRLSIRATGLALSARQCCAPTLSRERITSAKSPTFITRR
ncbi:Alpha-N-acetylglucosaminidase (NAGLU) tim-barrel domain [Salmonella enterica subsp. salamae]|uniref:Alpha-N-acetylglucosaminidase (NAGLU) tim-barrel domain n=1 Tax=Salmonella enterica subsp. salamae TaxID=59202 RepID=A0A6D2GF15_SALER|nr:Alpha-N-acetylglucosaminidase (NAGLU) tim-barrel domain [Salmonella enterica subsp. salamae]